MIALLLAYQKMYSDKAALPALADIEFRNTSQNGEDGILLYIFALAGMGNRKAAELCASDGIECNASNLIMHFGWEAFLVDGDEEQILRGRRFYARHPETSRIGPMLKHTWVTVDNAQRLLEENGFADDLDLLSLDMDGNDYWVLKSLTVRPRVIVCEYNNRIPADEAVTIPYDDTFVAHGHLVEGAGFFGASLDAYVALLRSRGYRLIGANRHSTNAFFLREDVVPDALPEVSTASCLRSVWARTQQNRWWPSLRDENWVRVSAADLVQRRDGD